MLPFFRPDPAWQRVNATKRTAATTEGQGQALEPPQWSSSSDPSYHATQTKNNHNNTNNHDDEEANPNSQRRLPTSAKRQRRRGGGFPRLFPIKHQQSPEQEPEKNGKNSQNNNHKAASMSSSSAITAEHLEWLSRNGGGDNNNGSSSSSYLTSTTTTLTTQTMTTTRTTAASSALHPPPPASPSSQNNNNNTRTVVPLSPSQAGPQFPTVIPPPHHETVEDETIINSALAEAWFTKRREYRLQQQQQQFFRYNYNNNNNNNPANLFPQQSQQTPNNNGLTRSASYPLYNNHNNTIPTTGSYPPPPPQMDLRTGGFQQSQLPSQAPPTFVPFSSSSPPTTTGGGPVDVDSGILLLESSSPTTTATTTNTNTTSSSLSPPPVITPDCKSRNPFLDDNDNVDGAPDEPNGTVSSSSSSPPQQPLSDAHYFAQYNAAAAAAALDHEDTMTVLSKPNSLASGPSAATSDMTPVVSNVAYPSSSYHKNRHPRTMASNSSTYAASSSSVSGGGAYHYGNNASGRPPRFPLSHATENYDPHSQNTGAGGFGTRGGNGSSPLLKSVCCVGGTAAVDDDDNVAPHGADGLPSSDRNSCKGFLDARTYHGKLAILLVSILVMAIATMIVSATITFKSNQQNNKVPTSVIRGDNNNNVFPTMAPSAATSTVGPPTTTTTMFPTFRPGPSPPTISPVVATTARPTFVTSAPDLVSTPTTTTSSPTKAPTRSPTLSPVIPTLPPPTPRPVTGTPTILPTQRPTDALESWNIVAAHTILGPSAKSQFGTSVALSTDGRVLAVGAPEYLDKTGRVHVFHLSSTKKDHWETVAILTGGTNLTETFGFDVSLSGDGSILAVGAPGGNGTIYTFAFNPASLDVSTTYVPIDPPIVGQHPASSFGAAVAISDDGFRLVAGAPYASAPNGILNGHVRVFELVEKKWEPQGPTLYGDSNVDWLGSAVDIADHGNMIIASAPKNRAKKGYVRSWRWDATQQTWEQIGPDITNDVKPAMSTDRFGHSIALSEGRAAGGGSVRRTRVAVGSPWKIVDGMRDAGMTLVYELDDDDRWNRLGNPVTVSPADFVMECGNAVDLDGGILSVGIPGWNGTGAVAMYRYNSDDNTWEPRNELVTIAPEHQQPGNDFGVSLASRRIPETDGFALLVGSLMGGNDGYGSVTSFVKRAG